MVDAAITSNNDDKNDTAADACILLSFTVSALVFEVPTAIQMTMAHDDFFLDLSVLQERTTSMCVVSLAQCASNAKLLHAFSARHGVTLRPHVKTHKTLTLV